jgi:hypothetical protein
MSNATRNQAIALVMRGTSVAFVLTVLAVAAMLASQV